MKDKSILRCLEYERFTSLRLSGIILDFGGGAKANYKEKMMNWCNPKKKYIFESANINPEIGPTYLVGRNETIPVDSEHFDVVISLNTFEHIYNLHNAFSEIYRILKNGGSLFFTVPFIFRVHGHPNDYIRGTPSFWNKFLDTHGFKNIRIEALQWGPFSTALTISGIPGPFKSLRKKLAVFSDLFYFFWRHEQGKFIQKAQDASICSAPLGYFISANKELK